MTSIVEFIEVSCATEVFVATALLHREQAGCAEFTIQEIVNRAARENLAGELRSGINVHASQHCVANRAPNPAKHRMLFATGKHTRRLLLPGDEVHPGRTGKIFPDAGEMPESYLPLLEWARKRYESARPAENQLLEDRNDSTRSLSKNSRFGGTQPVEPPLRPLERLLQARGIGARMAAGIDPDDYIRALREGWE